MAKTVIPTFQAPTHDEIAARAYEIYLREGYVAGRDLDHWLQAEAELRLAGNGNQPNSENAVSVTPVRQQTTGLATPVVQSVSPIASAPTQTARPAPRRSGKRERETVSAK